MDSTYLENARRAGRLAAEALQFGRELLVPGGTYKKTYEQIVEFIISRGGFPAFPPQLSFDTCAAHFMIAPEGDVTFDKQVIKLDIGVAVDGVIGDNALTVDLSGQHAELVAASRAAVEEVASQLRIGMTLGEVGGLIESTIRSKGFQPIGNLSGHGLGHFLIHTPPQIPNVGSSDDRQIVAGMHFACEPFATDSSGSGLIGDSGVPEIFSLMQPRPVRSKEARKILEFVLDKYKTLPFSSLDLSSLSLPAFKRKVALLELKRAGVLQDHPPLVQREKGMVSQAEHTFLITEDGVECTTNLS